MPCFFFPTTSNKIKPLRALEWIFGRICSKHVYYMQRWATVALEIVALPLFVKCKKGSCRYYY